VIVPTTTLLSRAAILACATLNFPLLLRTPGFHTGQHFLRVDGMEQLESAVAELSGDRLTAIELLDARGDDGMARKYRVMLIDGHLYPSHLAISAEWKVHYFTADMADRPEHRSEEAAFLANMSGSLGPRGMAALSCIRDVLNLDYAGIDFGLGKNGEILFFEANATMVVNPPEPGDRWSYRRTPIDRIFDAVHRMLRDRASDSG